MTTALEKDASILRLLDQLWARLGKNAFEIVDHWENELFAVGIASPQNHRVLAYLSTYAEPRDRYYVELELPSPPNDDFPYQVAGRFNELPFEKMVNVLGEHFARAHSYAEPSHPKSTSFRQVRDE